MKRAPFHPKKHSPSIQTLNTIKTLLYVSLHLSSALYLKNEEMKKEGFNFAQANTIDCKYQNIQCCYLFKKRLFFSKSSGEGKLESEIAHINSETVASHSARPTTLSADFNFHFYYPMFVSATVPAYICQIQSCSVGCLVCLKKGSITDIAVQCQKSFSFQEHNNEQLFKVQQMVVPLDYEVATVISVRVI